MSLGSFALDESVFAFTVTRCTSLACVAGIYEGGGGGGGRGFEQKKKGILFLLPHPFIHLLRRLELLKINTL